MKKRKEHSGEHENSERWLLTYADLITLLLGLFVILYAMSKIDAGKYAEIVNALGGAFGSSKGVMAGNERTAENRAGHPRGAPPGDQKAPHRDFEQ